jgi:hypothetical protein
VLVRHPVGVDGALEPGDTFPVPALPAGETRLIRIPQGISEAIVAAPIPFTPRPRRIIDPRGMVWTTATDGSYRLTQHSLTGDTLATLERDPVPVPVADAERLAALEPFRGTGLDEDRVPTVHPPYEDVDVSDDGHLWVWRHVTPYRMAWDVFDPSNRYLGAVDSPYRPGEFVLRSVRPEALLGVWTDGTDVEYVVRLRIVKG